MNSKILISQEEYDALEERERKGKYSSEKVESYFSLVENILTLGQILYWPWKNYI